MSYQPPDEITTIETDYGLVHAAGNTSLLGPDYPRVAVVGSRDATADGLRRSYTVAKQLAENGVVVVSGLALGVDIEAHGAAVDVTGGRTIAVLATPLHRVYPPEHEVMQEHIYRFHLLASPFCQCHEMSRHDFLDRNKLMASIVDAVVVIEVKDRSGTTQMARSALAAGKPVFVVSPQPHDVKWGRIDLAARIKHFEMCCIVDAVMEELTDRGHVGDDDSSLTPGETRQ